MVGNPEAWPALPLAEWRPTCATLHLWTQIIGKLRVAQTPWLNHSWHSTLYVTARGLTTTPVPYGDGVFEAEFDFIAHALVLRTDRGDEQRVALRPRSVADFYAAVMAALALLGVTLTIDRVPNELVDAIPFDQDHVHAAYDPGYAHRFWRVLVRVDSLFKQFRTGFLGKVSPVHFFWGSFDLAVTRFSGRRAPVHPGGVPHLADAVVREAYSHEVSSAGFWPGGGLIDEAAFYCYAYPLPPGFEAAAVWPPAAYFHDQLGEFILPYEAVRTSSDPDAMVLGFLKSTYDAAADLANWDRASLDCMIGVARQPRAID
jgi:hypothetical protein